LAATFLTLGFAASGQAADKIRYEEIPQHLAPFGNVLAYRGFTVITADGKQHNGRRLLLETDHLRIFHQGDKSWEDLPSEQVSRIAIFQGGHFFHHLVERAEGPLLLTSLLCGGIEASSVSPECAIPATALFSPLWVPAAVTAPFVFAADGIAFLIPPKVYEIVH
jgi:hypothetical protein